VSAWIEVRLPAGATLDQIADLAEKAVPVHATSVHAFQSEPWHPGGYVLRVEEPSASSVDLYREEFGDDAVVEWDPEPDEELFGDEWLAVRSFFHASTVLGEIDEFTTRKLVHCFLNTRGLSWNDEIRFHLREAWKRIRLSIEIKLRVGPRYRSWKAAAEQANQRRD
jgi:hypothetical protein